MDLQPNNDIITFVATPVSPFTLRHLPLLGRLYNIANTPHYSLIRQFVRRASRKLYKFFRNLGMGGSGVVQFRRDDSTIDIKFDVRNTQFSALFLPEHLPCYEPETTALIERVVGKTGVFFDIGANWGWYSAVVASQSHFKGSIHAFEPNPSTYRDLVGFVSQAGLADVIKCHDVALGSQDGKMTMSLPDGVHSGLAKLDAKGDVEIKIARLDSLELPPPLIIKLDVEDHEYECLVGAKQLISAARPFIVFESFGYIEKPELTSAPLRLLEQWDYRLYFQSWLAKNGDPYHKMGWTGGAARFGLVPFHSSMRGLLTMHTNLVAVPIERVAELKAILSPAALGVPNESSAAAVS